jgi:MFS family permease
MAYNLGPAISPSAGSFLNDARGFRWIFYLTAILGAVGTLLSILCMSETYEPVLLRRKAARLRKQTGKTSLRSKSDIDAGTGKMKAFRSEMVIPLRMLLFSTPIFFTSLLTAIGYGWIYILYTTLPDTFVYTYNWAPKSIGLAYLGTAVGNLIGMLGGGVVNDAIIKRRTALGDTRPENRLLPIIYFWPMVSIGLFMYAWTAQYAVHWIAPLIGTAIFGVGAMSAIVSVSIYLLTLSATTYVISRTLLTYKPVFHGHIHPRCVSPSLCFGHGRLFGHALTYWRSRTPLLAQAIFEA